MTNASDRGGTRTLEGRRTVLALALTLVAVTAGLGAILGYALPARSGVDELTVLGVTFDVSPATVALYGAVSVGTVLATILLIVAVVGRFDENAV